MKKKLTFSIYVKLYQKIFIGFLVIEALVVSRLLYGDIKYGQDMHNLVFQDARFNAIFMQLAVCLLAFILHFLIFHSSNYIVVSKNEVSINMKSFKLFDLKLDRDKVLNNESVEPLPATIKSFLAENI